MIVIISKLAMGNGLYSNVYYKKGNIFQPIGEYPLKNKVEEIVKIWLWKNRKVVNLDRQKSGYKSRVQLFDEQTKKGR